MLVNINEDILKLLKLSDLEETESNKELIENVVNAYMVGGMFTAVQQGTIDVEKSDIKDLMDHYVKKNAFTYYKETARRLKKARCYKTTSDKQNKNLLLL